MNVIPQILDGFSYSEEESFLDNMFQIVCADVNATD